MNVAKFKFTLVTSNYQSYYFALRARNSFGVSNFTNELFIAAGNPP
jgi:hypothetical protein